MARRRGRALAVSADRVGEFETALYAVRPGARDGGLGDAAAGALRARAERVAARVDPESVAARVERGRVEREVRVQPGPYPGTTSWSALAPAGRSAQAWAAVCDLAADYCQADAALTVAQARADAFLDLILAQAQVSTTVVVSLTDETIAPVRSCGGRGRVWCRDAGGRGGGPVVG
ncbi:MAG: hypothetical protein IPN45_08570 [Actinomycetales bacterium]|nr:hypothetical protein [Actinomycetales bacterium]